MSFKGVLIVIGIVALGALITFGVEEIRFRVISRALVAQVRTLQEKSQNLQGVNDDLSQETKALKAQLEVKTQEYEKRISQLEAERRNFEQKVTQC